MTLATIKVKDSNTFKDPASAPFDSSHAFGDSNTASGVNSLCAGQNNVASAIASMASGVYAQADKAGQHAEAGGRIAATGDAQHSRLFFFGQTTSDIGNQLFINGTNALWTIGANRCVAFTALIVARRADADNENTFIEIKGMFSRNAAANTTALVGSLTTTEIAANDPATVSATFLADTVNGAITCAVAGLPDATVNWHATVFTTEIAG
jgi:hypothetical protein